MRRQLIFILFCQILFHRTQYVYPASDVYPACVYVAPDGRRTAGGRMLDGRRTVVGGARVVSGAEKKAFD